MKCTLSTQSYQWQNDDGSYGVGKLVQFIDDEAGNTFLIAADFGFRSEHWLQKDDCVQVSSSYTRELEFIPFGKLSIYPASPIEQPSK